MKLGRVYYNQKNQEDVLIVMYDNEPVTRYERKEDLVILYREEDIVGVNIFNASKHFGDIPYNGFFVDEKRNQQFKQYVESLNGLWIENDPSVYDLIVGRIVEAQNMENSDHLKCCKVDVGNRILNIVCGASNVKEGMKTVVAIADCILPTGVIITKGKLNHVESDGMLCSLKDLGIGEKGLIEVIDQEVGQIYKGV